LEATVLTMTLIQILESRQKALTVREVAELLGVSKRHIYEMIADGSLPAFQVGRSVRIDPQDFADWLRRKKSPAVQVQVLQKRRKDKRINAGRNGGGRPADSFLRKRINCLEAAVALESSFNQTER
jgi:excisionase family DNA binding protein